MAEFHECDATDAAPTKSAPTDSAPPDSVPHDSVPPDSVPSGSVSAGSLSQVPGLLAELDAVVDRLPHDKKVAAEATLAGLACEHTPAEIGELGHRLLDNLDPDGELTDDSHRKRRRNVWVNRQDAQQMSKLTGHLDPETRALIETLWAVWATPGLNNPDDPDSPPARNGWCLSPAPTGTCAQHPTAISPPPTRRCITPCVTSPTAATPTSSTSPPPVAPTPDGRQKPGPVHHRGLHRRPRRRPRVVATQQRTRPSNKHAPASTHHQHRRRRSVSTHSNSPR